MKSNNSGEVGTVMIIMMVVVIGAGLVFGKKMGMMGIFGMSHEKHNKDEHKNHSAAGKKDKQTTDPVCGMTVDVSSITFNTFLDGTTYYFCSELDKNKFDLDPVKYKKNK